MRLVYSLIADKKDFTITEMGSKTTIKDGNGEILADFRSRDASYQHVTGAFLFSMFKRDVKDFINRGNTISTKKGTRLYQSNFKFINQINDKDGYPQMAMTDINECYWRTARNLGIITPNTYEKGKPHKLARNICIGKLLQTELNKEYKKGKLKNTTVSKPDKEFEKVYWMIINRVYDCMKEIMSLEGTLKWNVDCVYYDIGYTVEGKSITNHIKDVIEANGYEHKSEPCFDHEYKKEDGVIIYQDTQSNIHQVYV